MFSAKSVYTGGCCTDTCTCKQNHVLNTQKSKKPMIHDKWQATNAWTIHVQFAGPVTGAQEGVIEGYTGLTQILSDRTLSNTCMPTNVTSSSAPEYYFGCYKVCISFPQKYYNKGPPRDRSERQHGPENWQQSSQKATTHVDRKGRKLLLWQWCIHFLSCESDICNSLLHFGCISGKITNSLPLFSLERFLILVLFKSSFLREKS